jgi:hypothetical protein
LDSRYSHKKAQLPPKAEWTPRLLRPVPHLMFWTCSANLTILVGAERSRSSIMYSSLCRRLWRRYLVSPLLTGQVSGKSLISSRIFFRHRHVAEVASRAGHQCNVYEQMPLLLESRRDPSTSSGIVICFINSILHSLPLYSPCESG